MVSRIHGNLPAEGKNLKAADLRLINSYGYQVEHKHIVKSARRIACVGFYPHS
ncbi:hypothetical protein DSECCO2_257020 [anaerobic digester metagenome]